MIKTGAFIVNLIYEIFTHPLWWLFVSFDDVKMPA